MIVRRLGPGDEAVVERLAERRPQTGLLGDERTVFLVAFEGEEPIGFMLAHELPRRHGDPTHLFVYEVDVAEGRRRRGIASGLFRALAALATARGIRTGFVITEAQNEAAMGLYRSLGAVAPSDGDVVWDFEWSGVS